MAAIFYFSAQPGSELDGWLPFFRDWLPGLQSFDPMHYVAYFGLGLTVAFAFGAASARWRWALINVIVCSIYGVTDEWHQAYVPRRSPDIMDLYHDAIGAAAAALIVLIAIRIANRRHAKNYTERLGRS
ncbi:hypothetical protein D3H35_07070 [Cohnella faecalis]|uniref:VanZ-like domain-containing protein n=2 Tax=Cohnella faecalis TaxID=2315694 RepID=A0A398CYP2_9BACL|nr:hypothetical protein D3H35_07070 [Cohnella faecalis]